MVFMLGGGRLWVAQEWRSGPEPGYWLSSGLPLLSHASCGMWGGLWGGGPRPITHDRCQLFAENHSHLHPTNVHAYKGARL
jgi:hypothetical protein